MEDLLKTYSAELKGVLQDKKNQEVLAIVGAVYLLSKDNKERNAIVAGLASIAFLPDTGVVKDGQARRAAAAQVDKGLAQ